MLSYSKNEVPDNYICLECGKTNCKLFREYDWSRTVKLLCVNCVDGKQGVVVENSNDGIENARRSGKVWYMAAIPYDNNLGYWEYGESPDEAVGWWCRLPDKADEAVEFTEIGVPDSYRCGKCGATNCKLWRNPKGYMSPFCSRCITSTLGMNTDEIDENGTIQNPRYQSLGARTDKIGPYIPAIPNLAGTAYWKYTAAPPHRVKWWKKLRTNRLHPQELFFR